MIVSLFFRFCLASARAPLCLLSLSTDTEKEKQRETPRASGAVHIFVSLGGKINCVIKGIHEFLMFYVLSEVFFFVKASSRPPEASALPPPRSASLQGPFSGTP